MKPDPEKAAAIDRYLADCLKARLNSNAFPAWPTVFPRQQTEFAARIDFHGIALLLTGPQTEQAGWPSPIIEHIASEARMQTLWEASHQAVIGQLIEALHNSGFRSVALKGTALAYSIHDDPSVRRRGDTDLLIETKARDQVRRVFEQAGFERQEKPKALQEEWLHPTNAGFTHAVDLHWAMSSSATISKAFGADHPRSRTITLPRLSPNARGTGAVDSFINVCFNRASHQLFGYKVADAQLLDGDRLIWAVDLHLLASAFSNDDWDCLCQVSDKCGLVSIVLSGIEFATRNLGSRPPPWVTARLSAQTGQSDEVAAFLRDTPAPKRFWMDFTNSPSAAQRWALTSQHLFPDREFLDARFPDAADWPTLALQLRRLLDAATRMLLGRKR